ncbi:hypothetical protein [Amycolatopsis sp. FDAARGOS 1241]|uniref:hypothetical protein n=1 Tax=Amycolatopsis sp. FDAARGOS 1241 TaxID=2778070 RepID=UPI00194FF3DA|nr:hypothetical protein [Amycolatopsis sp. FDAARGOS 1241]QRP42961.1 hypothetical protein I6J71_26310 [Amycolatopsis sp. FDAARGOS 1241]
MRLPDELVAVLRRPYRARKTITSLLRTCGGSDVSRMHVGCDATVLLTVREWELLATLPHRGNEAEPLHWCELEPGHDGVHFAFGQQSGDDAWWLVFDPAAPETPGLSAAVAQGYLAVPTRQPPIAADSLLADSAFVHLIDAGRNLLVRLKPQLQD